MILNLTIQGITKMKKFPLIGFAIATTLVLTACKSTPADPSIEAERNSLNQVTLVTEIEATAEGSQAINSTRYLARNLMSTEDREELRKKIASEAPGWNPANATIGFIGSAALTGNPFSVEGGTTSVSIKAALDLASYVFDGAHEKIGQMWLPKNVNGITIESPEQAKSIAEQLTVDALNKAYDKLGYDLHYSGTMQNGYNKLYSGVLRDNSQATALPKKPKHIVAILTTLEYKEVDKVDPVEALALGFTPAYHSSPAGHQITILGGHKTDANGNVEMMKSEDGHDVVSVQKSLWQTATGRNLYREISKELPWVQGDDSMNNRYVVHNGSVYSFFSTSPTGFLNKRIDG